MAQAVFFMCHGRIRFTHPRIGFALSACLAHAPPKATQYEPSIKDSTTEQDSSQLNNRAMRRKGVTPYATCCMGFRCQIDTGLKALTFQKGGGNLAPKPMSL